MGGIFWRTEKGKHGSLQTLEISGLASGGGGGALREGRVVGLSSRVLRLCVNVYFDFFCREF